MKMKHLRFRKNDPAHNLLAATQHWLRAHGCDPIVLGGIGVIRRDKYKFYVAVNVTGTPPTKQTLP
jgi:hypothetical protein